MSAPLSTTRMRSEYSAARCDTSRMVRVVFHGWSPGLLVEYRTAEAWRAFSAVMKAHDYRFRESSGGTFNCRLIAGSSSYSLHAYGLAIDLNPSKNPHGTTRTDQPAAFRRDIKAIRTVSGRQVFAWGGDWRAPTNPDPMHHQIGATPAELAAGLVLPPLIMEANMFPQYGDNDGAWPGGDGPVRYYQRLLRAQGQTVTLDGVYGPQMQAAVSAWWKKATGQDYSGKRITTSVKMRLEKAWHTQGGGLSVAEADKRYPRRGTAIYTKIP